MGRESGVPVEVSRWLMPVVTVANVNCDEVNTASVGNQLLPFLAVPLREIWTAGVS